MTRVHPSNRAAFAAFLRRDYEAGSSIRSLAGREGFAYGTIRRLLKEAGTTLRRRGGGLPRPRKQS
ncbi:helix-turn-helix domain-containing protein [Streptomyces sp. NPDC047070]|uniref:helix-turn-helix domain-containing protein n=1 Tax=Streptomyces sp. NPDC047070 TaxID=3154923 RepID=UPI003456FB04